MGFAVTVEPETRLELVVAISEAKKNIEVDITG